MGGMTFVDLRDRYGATQLVFNNELDAELCERANHLGREFVLQVRGDVVEVGEEREDGYGGYRDNSEGDEGAEYGGDSAVYDRG